MAKRTEKIKSVILYASAENGEEGYRVGSSGVTSIEWDMTEGLHCAIHTIKVFRKNKLFSEHPFHNVLGVYFEDGYLAEMK